MGRVGNGKKHPEDSRDSLKESAIMHASKGLKMGLWLEIEVIGVACELVSKLPDDWFVCAMKNAIDNKRYMLVPQSGYGNTP